MTARSLTELEAALRGLPAPPLDAGRLRLIVRRPAVDQRETPASVVLSAREGVSGDDWSRRPPRDPEAQLAVIRHDLATLIANGVAISAFGDNLFVQLDLSAENLPTGTRLRVGSAVVEVTAKLHNGCKKFQERFGADALRFVQAAPTRHENRRGIYWKVVEDGEVSVGSAIRVLSRPSS